MHKHTGVRTSEAREVVKRLMETKGVDLVHEEKPDSEKAPVGQSVGQSVSSTYPIRLIERW